MVVACDLNNDGFQDLYVGAWGDPDDGADFRSPAEGQGYEDRLYLNLGDGSFRDITFAAFGDAINIRSAASIACADVDNDGWLDLYVGNVADEDFNTFAEPSHPGHYNLLYLNNGDLTFTEVSEQAGVRGPQILMRSSWGKSILYKDPDSGEQYEGYDPTVKDIWGNTVGEPTGQTHAVLFFDYDDDRDVDLWVANDGDRFHLYRERLFSRESGVYACFPRHGDRQGRGLDGTRGRRLRWRRGPGRVRGQHRIPLPA